jgi:hypothetical protein
MVGATVRRDQDHLLQAAWHACAAYSYAPRAGFQIPASSTESSLLELHADACLREQAVGHL